MAFPGVLELEFQRVAQPEHSGSNVCWQIVLKKSP